MSVARIGVLGAVPGAAEAGAVRLGEALAKGPARGRWSEAVAEVCGPEAILATSTSSLQVSAIATGLPQPQRVVGMHFFNPPALMKLVEVVATAESSEQALAATTAVAARMGRTPIRAHDIDRAYKLGGGFKMGPFELIDLIGLDDEDGSQRGVPYGSHGPIRHIATEEILARLFAQISNEAYFALEERIASPEDMNTATRLGLNWPLGSLEIAEQVGPWRALETLERLEAERGGAYAPAPLLREAAGG